MPYTFYATYTCKCGNTYKSNHWKEPDNCPACRKSKSIGTHHKGRDVSYDGNQSGAPPSVYASTCTIHLRYARATCQGCRQVRDLINGYCELCRGNCANEAQCSNATLIK